MANPTVDGAWCKTIFLIRGDGLADAIERSRYAHGLTVTGICTGNGVFPVSVFSPLLATPTCGFTGAQSLYFGHTANGESLPLDCAGGVHYGTIQLGSNDLINLLGWCTRSPVDYLRGDFCFEVNMYVNRNVIKNGSAVFVLFDSNPDGVDVGDGDYRFEISSPPSQLESPPFVFNIWRRDANPANSGYIASIPFSNASMADYQGGHISIQGNKDVGFLLHVNGVLANAPGSRPWTKPLICRSPPRIGGVIGTPYADGYAMMCNIRFTADIRYPFVDFYNNSVPTCFHPIVGTGEECGVPTDEYLGSVTLLCHFDTGFSPAIGSATATVYGAPSIELAYEGYHYGPGVFSGNGATDGIAYSPVSIGDGDFTIEFFVDILSAPTGLATVIEFGAGVPWRVAISQGDEYFVLIDHNGTVVIDTEMTPWYQQGEVLHFAIVRLNGVLSIYYATMLLGTYATTRDFGTGAITLLCNSGGLSGHLEAVVDELRVTEGVARYTEEWFSTPDTEFDDGTNGDYPPDYKPLLGGNLVALPVRLTGAWEYYAPGSEPIDFVGTDALLAHVIAHFPLQANSDDALHSASSLDIGSATIADRALTVSTANFQASFSFDVARAPGEEGPFTLEVDYLPAAGAIGQSGWIAWVGAFPTTGQYLGIRQLNGTISVSNGDPSGSLISYNHSAVSPDEFITTAIQRWSGGLSLLVNGVIVATVPDFTTIGNEIGIGAASITDGYAAQRGQVRNLRLTACARVAEDQALIRRPVGPYPIEAPAGGPYALNVLSGNAVRANWMSSSNSLYGDSGVLFNGITPETSENTWISATGAHPDLDGRCWIGIDFQTPVQFAGFQFRVRDNASVENCPRRIAFYATDNAYCDGEGTLIGIADYKWPGVGNWSTLHIIESEIETQFICARILSLHKSPTGNPDPYIIIPEIRIALWSDGVLVRAVNGRAILDGEFDSGTTIHLLNASDLAEIDSVTTTSTGVFSFSLFDVAYPVEPSYGEPNRYAVLRTDANGAIAIASPITAHHIYQMSYPS